MVNKVPVDTGNLRNSRGYVVDDEKVTVGFGAEYAPFVNNGTRFQSAQHFFEPSITDHIEEYKAITQKAYEDT